MPSGANPLLVIAESLPAHLEDLKAERDKVVARLVALNGEIAVAESHAAVSAPESVPRKPAVEPSDEKGGKR